MILTELTSMSPDALPAKELAEHLRLGTAFVETSLQDDLLVAYLRAAISQIETRYGIFILERDFGWTLTKWRDGVEVVLPARPVQAILYIDVEDAIGDVTQFNGIDYALEQDRFAPKLVAPSGCLPFIPSGGNATVAFRAGFGAAWADVPSDIQQAVILLAAHYYENRGGGGDVQTALPVAVNALLEPHKPVRLGGAA